MSDDKPQSVYASTSVTFLYLKASDYKYPAIKVLENLIAGYSINWQII
ncbi:hypothetical protein [Fortiea sp. LEGE XX443]